MERWKFDLLGMLVGDSPEELHMKSKLVGSEVVQLVVNFV